MDYDSLGLLPSYYSMVLTTLLESYWAHCVVICPQDHSFFALASPGPLYTRVESGFVSSAIGFHLSKKEEFKRDAIQFATAGKKLQKIFGFMIPEDGEWKKRISFENWMKNQDSIEWLARCGLCPKCAQNIPN